MGLILKESPWAEFYVRRGKEGHPIYSKAKFFSRREVEKLLKLSGFNVVGYRSIFSQPPGQTNYQPECPISRYRKSAGFTAIGSLKQEG